jgi:hypothetical protein
MAEIAACLIADIASGYWHGLGAAWVLVTFMVPKRLPFR